MYMKIEEIHKDKTFQKFLNKKGKLQKSTIKNYAIAVKQFCEANNFLFHDFVKQQRIEQRSRIQDGIIIEYDPNYGTIDTYYENYILYLKEIGNKNVSVITKLKNLNSVLNQLGLKIPTLPELEDDREEWYVLSKEDINYTLSITSIKYSAIIEFLVSTGMRLADLRNLKIKDYMEATFEHHGCTELEEFLSHASDDMMGYWDFYPQKTGRFKIRQKTYNSPSSNKKILLMLHERYNIMLEKGGVMSKEDYLFSSQRKEHKGKLYDNVIVQQFIIFNERLQKEKQRVFSKKLKDGIISQETYDELIKTSPKFHAHALRKYYTTNIAITCSNPRAISLLEGHTSLLKTDINYVDVDVEDIDKIIYEEYMKVLPCFCFDDESIDFELLTRKTILENRVKELEAEKEDIIEKSKVENKKMVLSILRDYGLEVK